MRSGLAMALAVTALALAGCSGPHPAPAPTLAEADRQARGALQGDDVMDALLEAPECAGWGYVAFVPATAVRPELPGGFEPAVVLGAPAGAGVNNPHLQFLHCATVVVDNATTESDVSIAYSGTLLANGDFYRWETFIDEPEPHAILAAFTGAGWPAQAATVTDDATGEHVRANATSYDVLAGPPHLEAAGAPVRVPPSVVHNVGPDGVQRHAIETLHTATSFLYPGTLQATGGVWSRIAQRVAPGPLEGTASDIYSGLRDEVYG